MLGKEKKQKKTELRLGAGIILNQEITYSEHWKKNGLRALASALILYMCVMHISLYCIHRSILFLNVCFNVLFLVE